MEFFAQLWLSFNAFKTPLLAVAGWFEVGGLIKDIVIEQFWLEPGVLEVDLWFFGDDGALPTVLRAFK